MARTDRRAQHWRRRILRELWGADEPPHLDEQLHHPQEFLADILRHAQVSDGIDEERLREIWADIAGDFIAHHTSPAALRQGCLTLRVLQPAMRFQLEQMKPHLIANLAQALGQGVVTSIRFSLG